MRTGRAAFSRTAARRGRCPAALGLLAALLGTAGGAAYRQSVDLAGTWRFSPDPAGRGVLEGWNRARLGDSIRLPGTADANRRTAAAARSGGGGQSAARRAYIGAAWYQRDLSIPSDWRGRRITLFLERTQTADVWVDGRHFGRGDAPSTPHIHDVSAGLTPGLHTLTIRVDNSAAAPETGNGISGRVELRVTDKVWIEDVRLATDQASQSVLVRVTVGNATGSGVNGTLEISGPPGTAPLSVTFCQAAETWTADGAAPDAPLSPVEFGFPLPPSFWSAESAASAPRSFRLVLKAEAGGYRCADESIVAWAGLGPGSKSPAG